jgi:hypothetical protein
MTDAPRSNEQMLDTPIVSVDDLPSAASLADQASIYQDLRFVVRCCEVMLPMLDDDQDGDDGREDRSVLVQSLWSAALVAYVRCFAPGKRYGLTTAVFAEMGLTGEVEEFHIFIKDMRDKHIAHSVNPFETVTVGAVLSPEGATSQKVEGIAHLTMRHIVADRVGVIQLATLADRAAKSVARRAEALMDKVLEEATALPIDALYARPRLRLTAPAPESAGTPRPRGRTAE